jgi:hypothetical protein
MKLGIPFDKIIIYQSWWSLLIMEVETFDRYVSVVTIHWTGPCALLFYELFVNMNYLNSHATPYSINCLSIMREMLTQIWSGYHFDTFKSEIFHGQDFGALGYHI